MKFATLSLLIFCIACNRHNTNLSVASQAALQAESFSDSNSPGFQSNLSRTFKLYNTDNSKLPDAIVNKLTVDADNNIWVATYNGLVRIAANNWSTYTYKNSGLPQYQDGEGDEMQTAVANQIIATKYKQVFARFNAVVYQFKNNVWMQPEQINPPKNEIRSMYPGFDQSIWFATYKELKKFNGTQFITGQMDSLVLACGIITGFADSKNRHWLCTYRGNFMVNSDTLVYFQPNISPISGKKLIDVAEDEKGNIWFSAITDDFNKRGSSLSYYTPAGKWVEIKHPDENLFSDHKIESFVLDQKLQQLWLAVSDKGLLMFDINNNNWELYSKETAGFPGNSVYSVVQDKQGTIWVGVNGGLLTSNPL